MRSSPRLGWSLTSVGILCAYAILQPAPSGRSALRLSANLLGVPFGITGLAQC